MAKMTKNQLIDAIAEGTQVSKGDVKAVIEQMAIVGYKELNESGEFVIPGFAKMSVVNKPATEARSGVNPFTKEPMEFAAKQVGQGVTPEGCQRRCLKQTGWLRRVRSYELWVIPSHPRRAPPPAHYAPRDGISGGPRGTVSQRPCGVMPAWPFVFYCLMVKIGSLGKRPLLDPSRTSAIGAVCSIRTGSSWLP